MVVNTIIELCISNLESTSSSSNVIRILQISLIALAFNSALETCVQAVSDSFGFDRLVL